MFKANIGSEIVMIRLKFIVFPALVWFFFKKNWPKIGPLQQDVHVVQHRRDGEKENAKKR